MLNEPPPRESAEQKAQRYWKNNRLILSIIESQNNIDEQLSSPPPKNDYLNQLRQFKRDIKAIILQRPTEMLTQYLISLQSTKYKLLREKLRRLERNNAREL